ncbi:histone-lysine N-methyltransferase eggless-like [Anopheles albimanus]|uniref:histone-lysine N-methyltransferase eggless-like n=1 Tax=Anopheles albimanus TaxID=7167 RepID=UPI001641363C|nr:histone-lysine N-methyltransferase eggless-like [Anopheles albimanus]
MDAQASKKAEAETETILLESDDETETAAPQTLDSTEAPSKATANEPAKSDIEAPEITREEPPEDPEGMEQITETPAAEKEEDVILIVDDEKEPENVDQAVEPTSQEPSTLEADSTVADGLASQIGKLCTTGDSQDVVNGTIDEVMNEDGQEQENAEAPSEAEPQQNDMENEEQTTQTESGDAFEMLVEETIENIAAAVDGNIELEAEPVEDINEKVNAEPVKDEQTKTDPGLPRSDCCNLECSSTSREYVEAPLFAINFYDVSKKKNKAPLLCTDCFGAVIREYENYCTMIVNQTPVVRNNPTKKEVVEIIDSDDEDKDKMGLLKHDNETPLPQDIIALVESELEDVIKETFDKYKIQEQMTQSFDYIKQMIAKNEECSKYLEPTFKQMSKRSDEQLFAIYGARKLEIKQLPELIINDHNSDMHRREPITQSQVYYAYGDKLFAKWRECRVIDKVKRNNEIMYYIKFLQPEGSPLQLRSAKGIAYRTAPIGKLMLGTRVIAKIDSYVGKGGSVQDEFYPGVVAESLGSYNRFRYLIFYDDGYAQYVPPKDVRVVCFQSRNVWEDVDIHSREFIKDYLIKIYKIRPMVHVKPQQRLMTERNATWYDTVVTRLDASLIEVYFFALKRHEWIYRGSTRFAPLFYGKGKNQQQFGNKKYSKLQQRNEPSIEYMTIDDDDENSADGKEGITKSRYDIMGQTAEPSPPSQGSKAPQEARSDAGSKAKQAQTARKSTVDRPTYLNQNIIYCDNDRPEGSTTNYTTKRYPPPQKFKPHNCGPDCLYKSSFDMRSFSHLGKPLLCGWERQICKSRFKKVPSVVYRGPCGRRLRSMAEVHRYLRITKATLNVDNFEFDPQLRVFAEYRPQNLVVDIPDVSNGLEYTPVSCVNYFDDTKPPPCEYSTKRIPTEGVDLNLDEDFLVCCDCEDDCFDKSKCQCWQLTIEGAKFLAPDQPIESIGYVYKRLDESVMTGIYECNARCKCKMNCLNRVVQHPLLTKLQIFKTSNRGWGIRCLNDIAKGSFICVYSGHLITDEASNQICAQNEDQTGDEYYAELDYIETVQNTKEGYESDVSNIEEEEDPLQDPTILNEESDSGPEYGASNMDADSDEEFTYKSKPSRMAIKTRSQIRKLVTESQDDELTDEKQKEKNSEEREPINLAPNKDMSHAEALGKTKKRKSLREYYGENEATYIMDAKKSGNLGRYFNHSCVPNLFVQNVFVDTHDARFPWVAFFAQKLIKAGSELTWNYNYDVGSVAGKVLYCHCGEKECRKRLL